MNRSVNDFLGQVDYVSRSVERILWQIDSDPLSPTYGCAHPAYWRDKTSEVSDTRRQEVMLAFSLLYCRAYSESPWKGSKRLLTAIEALFHYWNRIQYSDGSFDEWYVGERAYAAAAFSIHSAARSLWLMKGLLPTPLEAECLKTLSKGAHWLVRHDDLFKTNHQAVGVAALAWSYKVLQDPLFRENAGKKLDSIIGVQTDEGWFPEIGGMDPGYTFLTVEYAAMAMEALGNWEKIEPFRRAFDFACELVNPFLCLSGTAGICQNPYLSRIAAVLLQKYSPKAERLVYRFSNESSDFISFANVLGDDLRLLRWAFQPLVAHDLWMESTLKQRKIPPKLPLEREIPDVRSFPGAGFAGFNTEKGSGLVLAAAGGMVSVFFHGCPSKSVTDQGWTFERTGGFAATQYYLNKRRFQSRNDQILLELDFVPVEKFFPSFFSRICLRILSSNRFGSRMARKCIDYIRLKKGSPINQSSGNLSGKNSLGKLSRTISWNDSGVFIRDEISLSVEIEKRRIFQVVSHHGEWPERISLTLPDLPEKFSSIVVEKGVYFSERTLVILKGFHKDGDEQKCAE